MTLILSILLLVLLTYLCIQVAYLLFFSIAGLITSHQPYPASSSIRRIRVYIPGYKEDAVIIATARDAVAHDYPPDQFDVVVIADSFSPETLATLRSLPLQVVEVAFEKSTKGKALHKALEATNHDPVDVIVIIDADNHMAPGFLHAVNNAFEAGFRVVQGHRTAKNFETPFALLDACTEEINNHIFRRGHRAVGLPSALIGSGMAFEWNLFHQLLENIGDTSGEDKEIEFRIVRQQIPIAFLDGSYVFDEKVAKTAVFSKQRSRWLATQFEFFEKYFIEGWGRLLHGNVAFFNKVFQTYLLPRVMLVALVTMTIPIVFFWSSSLVWIPILLWFSLLVALLIGIPRRWYNRRLLAAFLQIPGALWSMLKALTQVGKARKQFIHTPHGDAAHQTH